MTTLKVGIFITSLCVMFGISEFAIGCRRVLWPWDKLIFLAFGLSLGIDMCIALWRYTKTFGKEAA